MDDPDLPEFYTPDDQTERRSISEWRIPGHLNEPIVSDECLFLLDTLDKPLHCHRHRAISAVLSKYHKNIQFIYTKCLSPWFCLLGTLRHKASRSKISESYHEDLRVIIDVALENYIIQKQVVRGTSVITQQKKEVFHKAILDAILNTPLLLNYYKDKRFAEYIKDRVCEQNFKIGNLLNLEGIIQIEKEIFIFTCPSHGKVLGPTSLFLCVLDILQTRFSLYLYWALCDIFNKYPKSLLERGTSLISFLESLYEPLGEELFRLLKCWEPYVIGRICSDAKKDTGFTTLLASTLESISDILPRFAEGKLPNLWFECDNNFDIMMSLELCSLCKAFGHPLINASDGMREIGELTTISLPINPATVHEVRGMFVKTMVRGFLEKHKRWPNIKFICGPNPYLFAAYSEGRWLNEKEKLNIKISDWCVIEFLKEFDFDLAIDTTELLSDKSCSPRLQNWAQKYDPCSFKQLYNKSRPRFERDETRVLIRYLKGNPQELKQIITETDNQQFNTSNNIAFLSRKERELKKGGRLYCIQTFLQRLLQTACENNTNKFIFPYIKDQTMSDTEILSKKKIWSMLKVLSEQKGEIINLDLFRWNMLQRHESIALIAKDLDDLFGFRHVYQDSHLWMQRAYILNNSRLNPPDYTEDGLPVPGSNCHINQLGGLEGMKQKLWTIMTLMLIRVVIEEEGLKTSIIGQGDNIAILLNWGNVTDKEKQTKRTRFLTKLATKFEEVGLRLKLEETWTSTRLLEYGKMRWLNGVSVPNGTKRAMRLISDEHDGIPTFDTSLTMISTGTENIAMQDWIPDPAFILYSIETLSFLFRKNIFKPGSSGKNILLPLIWPSVLGGLPISNLPNHMMRGIDDQLTVWISLYNGFFQNKEIKHCFFQCIPMRVRGNIDLERLIKDIYSLNIISLNTPTLTSREIVKTSLPSFTTNPEVINILNSNIEYSSEITNTISSLRPFYAPLAHELWRNSNLGMITGLQNKLTNVQSVIKVCRDYHYKDVYIEIKNANDKLIINLKNIFNLNSNSKNIGSCSWFLDFIDAGDCSYDTAIKIRAYLWKMEVVGASQPVPWEQFLVKDIDDISLDSEDYIITQISITLLENNTGFRITHGPFPPYFGSSTKTKIKSSETKMIDAGPFLRNLNNIVNLRAWAVKENSVQLKQLCNILLLEKKTLLPPDIELDGLINSSLIVYGGNIQHRLHSVMESSGALINTLPTIATHIRTSTSSLVNLSRGGKDYNIHYQLLFLYIQSILSDERLIMDYHGELSPMYGTIFSCAKCTHEVSLEKFKLDTDTLTKLESIVTTQHSSDNNQAVIPIGNPRLVTETNCKGEQIIWGIALLVGSDIAQKVHEEYFSNFAERVFMKSTVKQESYSSINLSEVRVLHPIQLCIGIIFSSQSIRHDILIDLRSKKITKFSPHYSILASILMCIDTYDHFINFFNVKPENLKEAIDNVTASSVIGRCLIKFTREYICEIIKILMTNTLFLRTNFNLSSLYTWAFLIIKETLLKSFPQSMDISDFTTRHSNLFFKGTELVKRKTLNAMMLKVIELMKDEAKTFAPTLAFPYDQELEEARLTWRNEGCCSSQLIASSPCPPTYCFGFSPFFTGSRLFNECSPLFIYNNIEDGAVIIDKNTKIISRPIGIINKNINDWIPILLLYNEVNTDRNVSGLISCLADGSGTVSRFVLDIFPNCRVLFNTLLDQEDIPIYEISSVKIPALVGSSAKYEGRVINLKETMLGETNIYKDKFWKKFVKINKEFNDYKEMLLIDLEAIEDTSLSTIAFIEQVLNHPVLNYKLVCAKIKLSQECINKLTSSSLIDIGWIIKPPSMYQTDNSVLLIIISERQDKEFMTIITNMIKSCGSLPITQVPCFAPKCTTSVSVGDISENFDMLKLVDARMKYASSILGCVTADTKASYRPKFLDGREVDLEFINYRLNMILTSDWEHFSSSLSYVSELRVEGRKTRLSEILTELLLIIGFFLLSLNRLLPEGIRAVNIAKFLNLSTKFHVEVSDIIVGGKHRLECFNIALVHNSPCNRFFNKHIKHLVYCLFGQNIDLDNNTPITRKNLLSFLNIKGRKGLRYKIISDLIALTQEYINC